MVKTVMTKDSNTTSRFAKVLPTKQKERTSRVSTAKTAKQVRQEPASTADEETGVYFEDRVLETVCVGDDVFATGVKEVRRYSVSCSEERGRASTSAAVSLNIWKVANAKKILRRWISTHKRLMSKEWLKPFRDRPLGVPEVIDLSNESSDEESNEDIEETEELTQEEDQYQLDNNGRAH